MSTDPYARYLQQADEHFAKGEVVRAGQIWQAVLKQVPNHAAAREGLFKVKNALEAQAAAAVPVVAPLEETPTAKVVEPPAALNSTPESIKPEELEVPDLSEQEEHSAAPEPEPVVEVASVQAPHNPQPEIEEATRIIEPESPLAAAEPEPTPVEPASPEPAPVVPAPEPMSDDMQEKLMREGCTLFDMGQTEDALRKWELLLAAVPDHPTAIQYAIDARRELGLPLDGSGSRPQAAEMHPITQEVPAYGEDDEAADKLLREGCLLYDMGLPEEAIGKWGLALKRAPHRRDIQGFLDSAKNDPEHAVAATPSPAAPILASAADEKTRQAEHLLTMQRFEEAAFTFQQALDLDPSHPQAKAGLLRCRAAQGNPARPQSTQAASGPVRIEMDRPDPVPEQAPAPQAVKPPEALTKPAPMPRAGFQIKTPESLDISKIPDWVKDPKLWIGVVVATVLIIFGTVWYKGYARDSQLKADVADAHRAAVAKAAADARVPSLAESAGGILAEGQQALSQGDPVRAYLRAQGLLKKDASNGAAAQLLDKAKAAMPNGGLVGATASELQKHIEEGDLDQAGKVMDALLRLNPDDATLRSEALRLDLRLAEDHASQDRWNDAQMDLMRGRALSPEDPAWSGRLALLAKIQGMAKSDRALWIALLG